MIKRLRIGLLSVLVLIFAGHLFADGDLVKKSEVVVPSKKINVLIVDGFSNHDWKMTTREIRSVLAESGKFSVEVSTTPEDQKADGWDTWRPDFSQYDVVIQNCNSYGGRPDWPREVQKRLEDYVRGGGGLYVFHSANNAFPKWKAYNEMIGLGWRDKNFGWAITVDADGKVVRVPAGEGERTSHGKRVNALIMRMGSHPIHKGMPKKWMAADLEIYSYARGPAQNLTVLSYALEPRTQLRFPIEWTVKFGTGRVYNSTFGHVWKGSENPPSVRCVGFRTLLQRATEWLATGKVSLPLPADFSDALSIHLKE